MNKKERMKKELANRELLAAQLYGTEKYHLIEKNHRRILWLREYLGISAEPKVMSVASLLLMRFMANDKTVDN